MDSNNLDRGRAAREVVNDRLRHETVNVVANVGRALGDNDLSRLAVWFDNCSSCDLTAICSSS